MPFELKVVASFNLFFNQHPAGQVHNNMAQYKFNYFKNCTCWRLVILEYISNNNDYCSSNKCDIMQDISSALDLDVFFSLHLRIGSSNKLSIF